MKLTVKMKLFKQTKGTVVFRSEDENAAVTQLYVSKPAGEKLKQEITLTLED